MIDYITNATAANGQIRVYAATTKKICTHASRIHAMSPSATVALGRLLTAGALMGSMMKNDDEVLTLQVRGDGPIGGMTVTTTGNAVVKGYANFPQITTPDPLIVHDAVGDGTLGIMKDIGLKEPYVGNSPLISGEIAEDLTYYYAVSEQIPTSVALGVTLTEDGAVSDAGGFIIQLLPGTEDSVIDALEASLAKAPSITKLLADGNTPETIIELLLGEFNPTLMDTIPTSFQCDCSKARVTKALISIGEKDLQEMIADGKTIEVNCDFCSQHYYFEPEELDILLQAAKGKLKK